MSAIRAIVVEDMAPARAKLRRYLAEDCRVTLVGEAASCRQAAVLIAQHRPQIVFLDIQLPDGSAMDLLDSLPAPVKPISIFVTAFDQHALRAFEMDARDYLLKPYARERFRVALNRAIEQLPQRGISHELVRERRYARQMTFKDRTGRHFIDLNEVDAIAAEDHYLRVRWRGRVYLIRGSLRVLQRELDPDEFMRVHRRTVVRIASIKSIRGRGRGDYAIELRDGSAIPVSRSHHPAIKARFSLKAL